jgi:hypothetical protein
MEDNFIVMVTEDHITIFMIIQMLKLIVVSTILVLNMLLNSSADWVHDTDPVKTPNSVSKPVDLGLLWHHLRNKRNKGGQMLSLLFWLFLH